ncbi:MAG TPA: hypothetical protein VHC22_13570 [Pirellulales bacterium]|nr:hypothetical protein [Pirellulales bacterium]
MITVSGQVLDPQGKPLAGATIAALHSPHHFTTYPPLAKRRCDPEGRFTVAFRKSQYAIGLGPADNWKDAMIVASADGFGLAWIRWREIPAGRELTLQLVEDMPITGRVVDLDGRPVVGAEVNAGWMSVPKDGALDAWLEGVRRGESNLATSRLLAGPALYVDTWSPRPAVTDRDGRFRIAGLGRERVVEVSFSGPAIAISQAKVVTRPHDPLEEKLGAGEGDLGTVYGADFVMVASPSQPIEGIVRDADSGEPLPGVRIESWSLAGRNWVPLHLLGTTTDASGHYRLSGMPKGKGNKIMALPNDDQPYLMRKVSVPEPEAAKPVTVDIDLHRGVWISGRVTDKATHKGVLAQMYYWPFRSNEFAQRLPEFAAPDETYGVDDRYATHPDGTYRLVALPGRGIVGAKCKLNPYRLGVGAEEIAGAGKSGAFDTYWCPQIPGKRWPHAMKEVDPPDAETFVCDLSLDPGGTITVNVVDPDGQPLGGFEADGKSATWHGFGAPVQGHSFDVAELGPDETRTVVIRHKQRKLATAVNVRLADHPGGAMSVALAPSAKIVGRVVDQNGAAVPAATVTLYWYGLQNEGGSNGVLSPVATDDRGRFEYSDVPSGCIYNIQTQVAGNNRIYLNDFRNVAPGEAKDLGEIKVGR